MTDERDGELTDIINASKLDLGLAGITNIDEEDPLIIMAVTLYAKANNGFSEDSPRFKDAYDSLKRSLCLSGEYNNV